MDGTEEITTLLSQLNVGEVGSSNELVSAVYKELKRLAAGHLRKERANHTLQPTALAHEACMRLLKQPGPWKNREHLFRTAAKIMRQILTDYARSKFAQKRGANQRVLTISELGNVPPTWRMLDLDDLIALDSALQKLKDRDPRQCDVVEMRFFAGLNEAEIADALQVSVRTVKRDWEMARAWLFGQLRSKGN